jgi:hypothetical protein
MFGVLICIAASLGSEKSAVTIKTEKAFQDLLSSFIEKYPEAAKGSPVHNGADYITFKGSGACQGARDCRVKEGVIDGDWFTGGIGTNGNGEVVIDGAAVIVKYRNYEILEKAMAIWSEKLESDVRKKCGVYDEEWYESLAVEDWLDLEDSGPALEYKCQIDLSSFKRTLSVELDLTVLAVIETNTYEISAFDLYHTYSAKCAFTENYTECEKGSTGVPNPFNPVMEAIISDDVPSFCS